MRIVFGLVLILGLGIAGFAVHLTQQHFAQKALENQRLQQALQNQVNVTEIYVAARPLRYGERLKAEDVRRIRFPTDYLPEGHFSDEAVLFPPGNNDPRFVLRAIEENEPLLAVKVTEPGAPAGVATLLSRGMRAFTIKVDVASGVSGFLNPGDRVDVYWSGSVNNGPSVTKLIEANVKIIAIDQTADQDRMEATIARTVTVEATPVQVAALAQAQSSGNLSLSLVGVADDTVSASVEVDQKTLLGIEEQVVIQAAPDRVCTIKTRRGGELVDVPIACTN